MSTYETRMKKGYPGLIYDLNPHDIVSKSADGAGIKAGYVVSRGTKDDQVVAGGALTGFGIAVRDPVMGANPEGGSANLSYEDKDTVPVMTKGYIWVESQTDPVSPGDPVKYVDASGIIGFGAPGSGESALTNAFAETSLAVAGSPDLVLVRFLGNTN